MVTPALLALAMVSGVPLALVALGWAVMVQPGAAALALGAYLAFRRWRTTRTRPGPDDEAAFLRSLSAEMVGGASLRSGLVTAAEGSSRLAVGRAARAAEAGLPAGRVADLLADALPVNGRVTASAWVLAAESGGPAAVVMQALSLRAATEGELVRERRALTAQARASAWVVAGIPLMLLLGMVVTGRIEVGADPALGLIIAVGGGLQALGVAVVVAMVRRAGR